MEASGKRGDAIRLDIRAGLARDEESLVRATVERYAHDVADATHGIAGDACHTNVQVRDVLGFVVS